MMTVLLRGITGKDLNSHWWQRENCLWNQSFSWPTPPSADQMRAGQGVWSHHPETNPHAHSVVSTCLCSTSQFRSTGVSTALTTKRWTWSPSSGQWDRPSTRTWWWGPLRRWTSTPWCATSWASSPRSTTATWMPPNTCWLAALLLLGVSRSLRTQSVSLQHLLLIYRDAQPSFHTFPRQTEAVVSGSVLVVRLELFYKKELKNTDVMTDTVTGDS